MSSSVLPDSGPRDPILEVQNLEVIYDGAVHALRGAGVTVNRGAVVSVLGANGAGKTTLLRGIAGLLPTHGGQVSRGDIILDGSSILGLETPAIVRRGVGHVMEGRRIFAELTVDENLRSGSHICRDRARVRQTYDEVMHMFPVLAERHRATAGYLSGGEQQMLALGRALMASPRLLLLDEPSLGVAPLIVNQIRDTIAAIATRGTSVVLVEQNAVMALSISQHGYVLENGIVVRAGPADELATDDEIRAAYLGKRFDLRS